MHETKQTVRAMLGEAFNQLQSAVELLDRAGAPGQIAANVDLAINQLLRELAPGGLLSAQIIPC